VCTCTSSTPPPPTPDASDEDLVRIFEKVKNWGRWGKDDQKGTLNLITSEVRKRAASLVRDGESYSISRDMPKGPGEGNHPRVDHHMMYFPGAPGTYDYIGIASHGYYLTHMDALAHGIWEGKTWNGFPLKVGAIEAGEQFGESAAPGGVSHDGCYVCGLETYRDGIFTRGVFLDVAAAKGVEYLDNHYGITGEDLELAEQYSGVKVEPGDALFVRMGLFKHAEALGHEVPHSTRGGLIASAYEWIGDRDVAVYGGDCIEKFPYSSRRFATPFHQIALVAMGLCLLDWPEVERLAEVCKKHGRNEFLLNVAPIPLKGATGAAVNPIVTF
jgi:kynurenine formamidase